MVAWRKQSASQVDGRMGDDFLKDIVDAAASGAEVSLPGFRKFKVKTTPERDGRNAASGEKIEIAASKRLAFAPANRSRISQSAGPNDRRGGKEEAPWRIIQEQIRSRPEQPPEAGALIGREPGHEQLRWTSSLGGPRRSWVLHQSDSTWLRTASALLCRRSLRGFHAK
jgi:nucleoid DNA-binding protein